MVLFSYKKGPTADVCETIIGMTDTEDTMFLTREGMEVEFNGKLPNMTSRSPIPVKQKENISEIT
jgi:hypothetical protein